MPRSGCQGAQELRLLSLEVLLVASPVSLTKGQRAAGAEQTVQGPWPGTHQLGISAFSSPLNMIPTFVACCREE